MRTLKLTQDTQKNILESLLKRSPNNYTEFEGRVNDIIANVREKRDEKYVICPWLEEFVHPVYLKNNEEFLKEFDKLSDSLHIPLPKGAGRDVDTIGEEIVEKYGEEKLQEIAKVNFKNTDRILHTLIY